MYINLSAPTLHPEQAQPQGQTRLIRDLSGMSWKPSKEGDNTNTWLYCLSTLIFPASLVLLSWLPSRTQSFLCKAAPGCLPITLDPIAWGPSRPLPPTSTNPSRGQSCPHGHQLVSALGITCHPDRVHFVTSPGHA